MEMNVLPPAGEAFVAEGPAEPLAPGTPAPDFTLRRGAGVAEGPPLALRELRGQPVVLAFFPAEWDPARGEQLALYNRLVSALSGQPPRLVALTVDGIWCRAALADRRVQFPLLVDLGADPAVAARYGVAGREALFMIDGDGV